MLAKYSGLYYGSRLTVILPLTAAHSLMPALPAQLALLPALRNHEDWLVSGSFPCERRILIC
jgi:hypothetical protein